MLFPDFQYVKRLFADGSPSHYNDVIMSEMASLITRLTIVYSTVIKTQIKENIKAPRHWPFCVRNSPHKWTVTRKMFPFDDVIVRNVKKITSKGEMSTTATKQRYLSLVDIWCMIFIAAGPDVFWDTHIFSAICRFDMSSHVMILQASHSASVLWDIEKHIFYWNTKYTLPYNSCYNGRQMW